MGRSAGPGSPVYFRCKVERDTLTSRGGDRHVVELTGRERPYSPSRTLGTRSTYISREYRCLSCGHVGWSNHVDLAHLAGAGRYDSIDRPRERSVFT
jgi:hypothetical protein